MFGVVPKVLWESCCPADDLNRIQLALTCLLILAGGKRILVDTGLGDKWPAKYRDMFAIERPSPLLDTLKKLGLCADDIDVVINTHLHFDHSGGNTDMERGRVRPTFRKAKYVVQRGEFDEAECPNERTKASYREENLAPVAESRQWEFLDGHTTLFPGISLVVTGGHTAHHQGVRIESEGKVAFFLGDLIPTASHLPLPYIMGYDLFPIQTLEAKRHILRQACDGKWLLVFEHDPHIQFGSVQQNPEGQFVLQPGGSL